MGVLYNLIRWIGLIGTDSADVNTLVNDGNASYFAKDYDRAIAAYTEAIRLNPAIAILYCNRAGAWYGKLAYDQALADCNEAIRLDPKFANSYVARAGICIAKQEFDQAIADSTAALRLNPDDALAYMNRGNAWYGKQEFEKALDDFHEAIHLDPKSVHAWSGRGAVWLAKQESERTAEGAYQLDNPRGAAPSGSPARAGYDRALADFNEAIRLDPIDAYSFIGRGAVWHCLEQFDNAIDDYSEAIRIDPVCVHAHVNRGHAWREKRQYRKAIDDFEQARRLAPKDAWAPIGLAWLLATAHDAEFRDGKEAVALAHTALLLEPKLLAAAQDTLAVAYAEAGDFEIAIAWEERALKDAPPAFADEMRKRLELFRNKQPYRQETKRPIVTHFMPAKGR
jgi:tetratricopeptide (TPR) repeat protein